MPPPKLHVLCHHRGPLEVTDHLVDYRDRYRYIPCGKQGPGRFFLSPGAPTVGGLLREVAHARGVPAPRLELVGERPEVLLSPRVRTPVLSLPVGPRQQRRPLPLGLLLRQGRLEAAQGLSVPGLAPRSANISESVVPRALASLFTLLAVTMFVDTSVLGLR